MNAEKMAHEEVVEFLRSENTGVLSLTSGRETYAIPESFGYNDDTIYFQFANREDSHKMSFIETTDVATFTVFSENPTRSVIIRGTLESVPEDEMPEAMDALAENATVPTLNVFPDTTMDELSFELYRINPKSVSGRRFSNPHATPAMGLSDICVGHLEDALERDDPIKKDFHIRQAVQACLPFSFE